MKSMPGRPRSRRPLIRLAGTMARLPRYLNLAQALARDNRVSASRKAALAAGIGYVALPLDLVPGIIPILGQLDDLAALLLSLRYALNGCSDDVVEEHLHRAGLSTTALEADLATVRATGIWLVVGGVKLGTRAITAPFSLLGKLARRHGRD